MERNATPVTTRPVGETEVQPTKEELQMQLVAARDQWAAVSARRQRRMFDGEVPHEQLVQNRYHQVALEYGKLEVKDRFQAWKDEKVLAFINRESAVPFDGIDDATQYNLIAVTHWLEEQNTLREATKRTVEGKKTWKFADAFSRFLNTGTRTQRIAKGVAFGLAVGAVGSLAGGVAGAAVIGTGIVAAGRFARGYASRHRGGIGQVQTSVGDLAQEINADGVLEEPEFVQRLHETSIAMFEHDTKKEQSKQRRAFAMGVGSVALGVATGAIFGSMWASAPSAHADVGHINPNVGGHSIPDSNTLVGSNGEVSHAIPQSGSEHVIPHTDSDHAVPETKPDVIAETEKDVTHVIPDAQEHAIPDAQEHVIPDAREHVTVEDNVESIKDTMYVEHGSGLIREMKQATKAAGYDVDDQTAYKLYRAVRNKFGNDGIIDVKSITHDTYLHGNDLRISAPGKASWRSGVTDYMEKWLENHGHNDVKVEHSSSHVIPEHTHTHTNTHAHAHITPHEDAMTPSQERAFTAAHTVSPGETWRETMNEMRHASGLGSVSDRAYASILHEAGPELAKLHYSGTRIPIAYRQFGEWRMNMSPLEDRRLPERALKILSRAASRNNYDLAV